MKTEYIGNNVVSGKFLREPSKYYGGTCVRRICEQGNVLYIVSKDYIINLYNGDSMLINPNELFEIVNAKVVVE